VLGAAGALVVVVGVICPELSGQRIYG
jgi:hypothetical protein